MVTAIIGGALGFGMSYSVLNPEIVNLEGELQALSSEFNSLSATVTDMGDVVANHEIDL